MPERTRGLLALLALPLLAGCGPAVDGRESAGDKREWSVLQRLESTTRDERRSELEFRAVEGLDVVAVPAPDSGRPIWILLNPGHPPFYKQMPSADYTLSRAQLREILARARVTSTVEEVLRSHTSPSVGP